MTQSIKSIQAVELHECLISGEEIALIDVREQQNFGNAHLLLASNIALGQLELGAPKLIPRRSVPVVVCDDGEGLAEQAAAVLCKHGHTGVSVLDKGVSSWGRAGFEIFSGVNVLSKVFGEYVEHHFETPRVEASVLNTRLAAGEDIVILDSRPLDEFRVMCIPNGIDTPGAELVYRVRDLAPDPSTTVVVNCAGRTRSIIGCQSLLNAGVPNPIMALKDGTMGWHLAGLELEKGAERRAGPAPAHNREWARAAAARVARKFQVKSVSIDELARWGTQVHEHTLYIFDVREFEEYAAGHLPGARHAPGGQLVQATDVYLAVRSARVVLVDDCRVRATMTASWLNQMGMEQVYVLEPGWEQLSLETGPEPVVVLGGVPEVEWTDATHLAGTTEVVVIDLSRSLGFRSGHIPGAYWATRVSMESWSRCLPDASHFVLCADSDALTALSVAELSNLTTVRVSGLRGGFDAWCKRSLPKETGLERTLVAAEDAYHRPYDREQGRERAMQDYLDWEVALVEQMQRDDTVNFPLFD